LDSDGHNVQPDLEPEGKNPGPHPASAKRRASQPEASDSGKISNTQDSHGNGSRKKAKHLPIESSAIITLPDSEEELENLTPDQIVAASRLSGKKGKGRKSHNSHDIDAKEASKIVVTRKLKVDAVVNLDHVPTHWPVTEVDTAFIVDLSDSNSQKVTRKGKVKALDTFVKSEV
jgi:hypothetical protein